MTAICPHCGYDLVEEGVVVDGPFRFEPRLGLLYEGRRVPLAPSRRMIVGALMRSKGAVLTESALCGVIGTEDGTSNLLAVHICHIRRAITDLGAPCPIETVRAAGFRWDSGADHGRPRRKRAMLLEPA